MPDSSPVSFSDADSYPADKAAKLPGVLAELGFMLVPTLFPTVSLPGSAGAPETHVGAAAGSVAARTAQSAQPSPLTQQTAADQAGETSTSAVDAALTGAQPTMTARTPTLPSSSPT